MTDIPAESTQARQQCYFGKDRTERHYLPDGQTFMTIKRLMEGDRRKYQDRTSSGFRMEKGSGDSIVDLKPGTARHMLIQMAVVGWNLVNEEQTPVECNQATKELFLDYADPEIVDDLEKAIRELNPWLSDDDSLDDLLEARDDLDRQIARKRDEEEGKADS